MKAYKDRRIVRKISVKCYHAFVIPVQFVAVIASQNVFSEMHAVYSSVTLYRLRLLLSRDMTASTNHRRLPALQP